MSSLQWPWTTVCIVLHSWEKIMQVIIFVSYIGLDMKHCVAADRSWEAFEAGQGCCTSCPASNLPATQHIPINEFRSCKPLPITWFELEARWDHEDQFPEAKRQQSAKLSEVRGCFRHEATTSNIEDPSPYCTREFCASDSASSHCTATSGRLARALSDLTDLQERKWHCQPVLLKLQARGSRNYAYCALSGCCEE